MPETLPESVRAFLRDHIDSYEQLELLLLLHREPHAAWTVARLVERTGVAEEEAEQALAGLARSACIAAAPGGAVRYAPHDAGLAAAIDGLAIAYEENRLAIIKLMNENAIERVRNAAIQTFADAFVIGRKKDG